MVTSKEKAKGHTYERFVASLLGGRRLGTMGKEDVLHDVWCPECKSYKRFAVEKFMEQAESHCTDGRIPVVFMHVTGKSHENDMVLFRLKDVKDYLKRKKTRRK